MFAELAKTGAGRRAYEYVDQVNDGSMSAADAVQRIGELSAGLEDGPELNEVRDAQGIASKLASATIASDSITGQAGLT
jgi:hypothetical protein